MNDIPRKYPVVLTIAGSDCSGGAGIQADIKAISALGAYAASVITAVTAQNTLGVTAIHPVPADIVRAQADAVFDDIRPDAVKIGMVSDPDIVRVIASVLSARRPSVVVYDPVMVSTSGSRLMSEAAIGVIRSELLPAASLITPNLQETCVLVGHEVGDIEGMKEAARELYGSCGAAVLVKGGHLGGDDMTDVLYDGKEFSLYSAPRTHTRNTHGTGCTLSSSIAALMALGHPMAEAVGIAKRYVSAAIVQGQDLGIGGGNGPLWHQVREF